MSNTTKPEKIEYIHCNECKRETKHKQLYEHVHSGSDEINEFFSFDWRNTYTMLECLGCENVTMKEIKCNSEMFSEDGEEVYFYPPRTARNLPEWTPELSVDQSSLMEEIYIALHAGCNRIAIMGVRALLDNFMTEKVGDIGGFKVKLDKLQETGFLSEKHRAILDVALEAGNATTHRKFSPDKETVNMVMDIIENLLQTDTFEEKTTDIKKRIPSRNKTKKRE
jgi:hypothetical protein